MENLFFTKGLISGLILLGQGDKHVFRFKFTHFFLDEKNGLPRIFATIVNLPNIAGAPTNLENFGHNSEPRH